MQISLLLLIEDPSLNKREIGFKQFKDLWLGPIFSVFPNLAIHEAVYEELVGFSPQNYVDEKRNAKPPEIIIHKDSSLKEVEKVLRD